MLIDTLGASLLGNLFIGNVMRAGYDTIRAVEGTI